MELTILHYYQTHDKNKIHIKMGHVYATWGACHLTSL